MLWTKFKNQQIEQKIILKFPDLSISVSLSSYKQKCPYQTPQLCYYCPGGLMVKLSIYTTVPICMCRFKSRWGQLFFFPQPFFAASSCQLQVSKLFLTMLSYYMELMKGLDEADKVHIIYWTNNPCQ